MKLLLIPLKSLSVFVQRVLFPRMSLSALHFFLSKSVIGVIWLKEAGLLEDL